MNANSIRVYTILGPAFYQALFEYNLFAKRPLYLFHGVWNNENDMINYQDAFHPVITGDYKSEIADLIDVLHGNKTIEPRPGHASGGYAWNVMPWVAGFILGIEKDAEFVINTNNKNPHVTGFDGEFLYTVNASPFEAWLAEIGDFAIAYKQKKYGTQRPISWTNWITTDPLWHYSDPDRAREDAVSVDIENIFTKDSFSAGLFVTYHVYPYYPEFMSYDPEYTSFIDDRGKRNPYEAYLRDLCGYHTVPVLVGEFGVPTSRGCTHRNEITGYNQGFIQEQRAGEMAADMYESIMAAGLAGGLVFTWQDEWFKRSWNTMDYDLYDRRAFWSNVQVSEQNYGILAFEPGWRKSVSYVDGDLSEWKNVKPLAKMNGLELSVLSDARFIYFLIRDSDKAFNIEETQYVIAVSGLKDQGNFSFPEFGLQFSNPVSQSIVIDGKHNSAVYVDAYYDVFYRHYSFYDHLGIVEKNPAFEVKNSGIFNPINLVLRAALHFPLSDVILPPSHYVTGRLLHGNANHRSPDYNSLADFYINPDNRSIELRIPWQLLNIADPSTKTIIGDLYAHDYFNINPVEIKGFDFELFKISGSNITEGGSGFYSWKPWETVRYHERLKKSYDIIKANFAKYGQEN